MSRASGTNRHNPHIGPRPRTCGAGRRAETPIAHATHVAESDLHPTLGAMSHYQDGGHLIVVPRGSARTADIGVPLPVTPVAMRLAGASTSIHGP